MHGTRKNLYFEYRMEGIRPPKSIYFDGNNVADVWGGGEELRTIPMVFVCCWLGRSFRYERNIIVSEWNIYVREGTEDPKKCIHVDILSEVTNFLYAKEKSGRFMSGTCSNFLGKERDKLWVEWRDIAQNV